MKIEAEIFNEVTGLELPNFSPPWILTFNALVQNVR